MKAIVPSPWRACRQCRITARRSYTTPSGIATLQQRPAKFIPDYLVPMPSHLLTTTLTDLLSPDSPGTSSPTITSPPQFLPPGHHLVYFPIQTPPSQLAADGADPDHSPGAPFNRRMWAGGEVTFADALPIDGREWACQESIGDVAVRGVGPSEKVFVDVWRRYGLGHQRGERKSWEVEERRTLVFMKDQESNSSPSPPRLIKYPHPASHSISILPNSTHLFHFSALTFNAHAIHLDPSYARSVDGHRALLVHGPLTLALMLRVLTGHVGGDVQSISYRNYAPLYVGERMTVCLRMTDCGDEKGIQRWEVWVEGPEGGLAVKGNVLLARGTKA